MKLVTLGCVEKILIKRRTSPADIRRAVISSSAPAWAVLFLVAFYFIPTIVGAIRQVPNIGSVIVINFFLGWTFIGWVVALAMAARSVPAR
jgi:Superinfection immunity protein